MAENLPRQRLVIKNMIRKSLVNNRKFAMQPTDVIDTMVRRMERACYNHTINEFTSRFLDRSWNNPMFMSHYSALASRYAMNLDPDSSLGSAYFADKLLSGEMKSEDLCNYGSKDINPDASEAERAYIETRQKQKVDVKYTTRYRCPRCFEYKATYNEVQIARADEAASNKLTCLNCGHMWFKTGV